MGSGTRVAGMIGKHEPCHQCHHVRCHHLWRSYYNSSFSCELPPIPNIAFTMPNAGPETHQHYPLPTETSRLRTHRRIPGDCQQYVATGHVHRCNVLLALLLHLGLATTALILRYGIHHHRNMLTCTQTDQYGTHAISFTQAGSPQPHHVALSIFESAFPTLSGG